MYRDSAGLPTIGVGHLLTKDELRSGRIKDDDWRDGISQATLDALLADDLGSAERAVGGCVIVPLDVNQFDTLVSLTFNIGIHSFARSTLLRLLNGGDYTAVPGQLRRWVWSAGVRDPILVGRREDEIAQWEGS